MKIAIAIANAPPDNARRGVLQSNRIDLGGNADIRRAQALRLLLHVKLDLLSLLERASVTLNRLLVDENIRATIVLLDKAEAFRVVEPFDSSLNHSNQILFVVVTTALQIYEGVSEGVNKE